MKATKFQLVEFVHPDTKEVGTKIVCVYTNAEGEIIKAKFMTDLTKDEIIARRSELLSSLILKKGEFGYFCYVAGKVLDEY